MGENSSANWVDSPKQYYRGFVITERWFRALGQVDGLGLLLNK